MAGCHNLRQVYAFNLRRDYGVTIELPGDREGREAERMAAFVRCLPIVLVRRDNDR